MLQNYSRKIYCEKKAKESKLVINLKGGASYKKKLKLRIIFCK